LHYDEQFCIHFFKIVICYSIDLPGKSQIKFPNYPNMIDVNIIND